MSVPASNTVPETETPTVDPVFRAMSALAKQGLGWEDLYVRLNAGGFVVTRAECRRFIFPLKSRRPQMRKGLATAPGASLSPVTVRLPTRNAD